MKPTNKIKKPQKAPCRVSRQADEAFRHGMQERCVGEDCIQ